MANFSSLVPLAKFDENSWWAFLTTNSPALYYFAAAACRWCPNRMIERKACLIEQTLKVKRRFLAERQMLRCNMIVSNKFSGCRELAFIYPYFELIFAK